MRKKTKSTHALPNTERRGPTKPPAPTPGHRVRSADAITDPPAYDRPTKPGKTPSKSGRAAAKAKPAPGPGHRPRRGEQNVERSDQLPPKTRRKAAGPAGGRERYIRLRVRVSGDRLSVVDSHLVDGPLGQTQGFSTPHAYEITDGDRLLHADGLPDLGVQRSFVAPDGPLEGQGHHVTEQPIYEFNARVRAEEVTEETLPTIAIRLHRVKDDVRTDRLGSAPLGLQFTRAIRPMAELRGLPASVLPEAIDARGGRTPTV